MPVQVICNFHKDPFKTKQAMLRTRSNTGFFSAKVNSPIWPEFELVRDFMPVQVISRLLKLSRICSGQG